MLLLNFLFYRIYQNVSLSGDTIFVRPFNFEEGGSFDIVLTKLKATTVLISMCNSEETRQFSLTTGQYTTCSLLSRICNLSSEITVENRTASYSDKILTNGRYRGIISLCDSLNSQYEINLTYRNTQTLLDMEKVPLLITKPIIFILICLAFIYWLINWILNCNGNSRLHTYFSIAYIITGLSTFFDILYYEHFNKSDEETSIVLVSTIYQFMKELLLISGMLFVSQGFGVVHSKISIKDLFITLITCGVVLGSALLYNNSESSKYSIFIFMLFLISLYYLIVKLMDGIRDALLHIYAHLLVIAREGIDPSTTPVWEKLQIYNVLSYILFSYFLIVGMSDIILTLFEVQLWIIDLIRDICDLGLLCASMYMFRIRPALAAGYEQVGEIGEPAEFTRDEIETMEFTENTFANATKVWEVGSPLPPQPIIKDASITSVPKKENDNQEEILEDLNKP